jgi:hypothetical protein
MLSARRLFDAVAFGAGRSGRGAGASAGGLCSPRSGVAEGVDVKQQLRVEIPGGGQPDRQPTRRAHDLPYAVPPTAE